jgi:hypothetical protein
VTAKPAAPRPWTVLPHGPLESLEPNLWRVSGTLPGSIPLRRVMTVARLAAGGLVVHSPIALDPAAMATLDGLGDVAFIVVPNAQHRLDASSYAVRYPAARVLAPQGGRAKIEKLVAVHGSVGDLSDRDVVLEHVAGTRDGEALMTVRSGDRTSLVFTDTVFNMPHRPGVSGWVLKHVTQSSGGPKVSRLAKLLMISDAAAFAAQLDSIAAQPIARVIVSHEDIIVDDPAGALQRIAASLR